MPKRRLDKDELAAYRRRPLDPEENRALRACAAFRGDVLMVESEHDDVVPHPVIANYLAAFAQGAFADLPGDRGRRPRPLRGARAAGLHRAPGELG